MDFLPNGFAAIIQPTGTGFHQRDYVLNIYDQAMRLRRTVTSPSHDFGAVFSFCISQKDGLMYIATSFGVQAFDISGAVAKQVRLVADPKRLGGSLTNQVGFDLYSPEENLIVAAVDAEKFFWFSRDGTELKTLPVSKRAFQISKFATPGPNLIAIVKPGTSLLNLINCNPQLIPQLTIPNLVSNCAIAADREGYLLCSTSSDESPLKLLRFGYKTSGRLSVFDPSDSEVFDLPAKDMKYVQVRSGFPPQPIPLWVTSIRVRQDGCIFVVDSHGGIWRICPQDPTRELK